MRKFRSIAAVIIVLAALAWQYLPQLTNPSSRAPATQASPAARQLPHNLPPQVADTLALIRRDGPFPYRRDGVVFHNREGHLPQRPDGYYHEYTVPTPGARTRGARRIVTGGTPPVVFWYTGDHYRSFIRLEGQP